MLVIHEETFHKIFDAIFKILPKQMFYKKISPCIAFVAWQYILQKIWQNFFIKSLMKNWMKNVCCL